jgi:hypothetical protein
MTEIEPIAPKEARARIRAAVEARLGANWNDEETGWIIVHDADYLLRVHQGRVNLDFQCDLLGEVSIIEREANPLQLSGRLVAWMVLGASLFLTFLLAQLAQVFG